MTVLLAIILLTDQVARNLSIEMRSTFPVRFAPWCEIADAFQDSDSVVLQMSCDVFPDGQTGALLADSVLYDWAGAISCRTIVGFGRLPNGPLLFASQYDNFSGYNIAIGAAPDMSQPAGKPLLHIALASDEKFLGFFPSDCASFMTNKRIWLNDECKRLGWREILLNPALPACRMKVDRSADRILAGASAVRPQSGRVYRARLFSIDATTGQCTPLFLSEGENAEAQWVDGGKLLLDSDYDKFSTIIADSARAGQFYVGIGTSTGTGRLLHIDSQLHPLLVFSKFAPVVNYLLGTPGKTPARPSDSANHEIPVLAIAVNANKQVLFATPNGVYRVNANNSVEFVGVPDFELVSSYFVARNIPGVLLLNTKHVEAPFRDTKGESAARKSYRLIMVPQDTK